MFRILFWIFVLVLILYALRRKKETVHEERPSLIDVKALNEAEKAVRSISETRSWKVAATYNTSEGYKETDLMEIIAYLGSHGIPATFEKTGVGLEGGAVNNFLLKLPFDQLEKAKNLLEKRK